MDLVIAIPKPVPPTRRVSEESACVNLSNTLDCQPFFVHKDAHFLSSSCMALFH